MIAAVVLAAGDSARMGRPKALLEWEGGTFLEAVCRRLREAGVWDAAVVLGRDAETVLNGWRRGNERVVVNPRPDEGMISSVRLGLKALDASPAVGAALICLADMPAVRVETIRFLCDEWRRNRGFMLVPRFKGKRGHPLVLDARYWHETSLAPDDQGLHWVTHRHPGTLIDVDVDDPGVVSDADTPEDYGKLVASIK
jgi:molybdenum cofactor cytidylyltransferase